jgi:hypothetical protein
LAAGGVARVGGDVGAVEGVECFDHDRAWEQRGDVLAAGDFTEVGDLGLWGRLLELVGGINHDAPIPIGQA